MDLTSSARPVDSSLWKKMWRNVVVKADNKDTEGDKGHSGAKRHHSWENNIMI